jgi:UDP-2-acetamido-3-amino-2,3-dideoxy-glucuronate N-acetyltransferase
MSGEPVDYGFRCLDDPAAGRGTIHLPSDVHPSVLLGDGAVVWRFAVILEGVRIGKETVIGAGCFIGRHVIIGQGTRVHPHAAIPDNAVIGNHVYIGSNVTLTDSAYPNLTDKIAEEHRPPIIEDHVILGCNCVVLPGVVIREGAVIGAGSVVTHDVGPGTVVAGNPARALVKARRLVLAVNEAGEVVD